MVPASGQDPSWTSPWGDATGMPIQEETPGQTKDTLGYFLVSLRRRGKWPGRGSSGSPCTNCCPRDPDADKHEKTKQNKTKGTYDTSFSLKSPRLMKLLRQS